VDAVVEVAAVREPELAPPPPLFRGLSAEYLRGIARRDGRLVILLDIDRLLSSTERLVLEQAVAGVEADRGRNGGATRGRH
jgi:purine-binding chemotaxis protein CheW